jgi:UDP-N-acetylmuramoyl-L-alanyl-D-glutamate--2,6-diaminopimelate ligase
MDVASVLDWLVQRGCAYPPANLRLDSRAVAAGDVFVAVPGAVPGRSADGRDFIETALARGAAAVLAEEPPRGELDPAAPVLWLDDLHAHLGEIAAAYYGSPAARLKVIGVTGTNGKTSCSQWIAQLLTLAGARCAVAGTIGSGFVDQPLEASGLTTPDAITLQRDARRFADAGARAIALEVSSIGLHQHRLAGLPFHVALFTNLTRDHLDYHGTMDAYAAAKTLLFEWPTLVAAVLNLDDPLGRQLAQRLRGRTGVRTIGYTAQEAGGEDVALRLQARDVEVGVTGLRMQVGDGSSWIPLEVGLVGRFNVSNLLGVLGVAVACGLPLANACVLAPRLVPPPGRMQRVGGTGEPLAVVDYAHTPDALVQALAALRPLAQARGGALWVVFGAGGNRDPGKRAPMGAAAAAGADRIVITSDNPRTEDPVAIVAAIEQGVPPGRRAAVRRIVDRAEAILQALLQAGAADVVLIAGKGHEEYQEIHGERRSFSDALQARVALAARAARGRSLS